MFIMQKKTLSKYTIPSYPGTYKSPLLLNKIYHPTNGGVVIFNCMPSANF